MADQGTDFRPIKVKRTFEVIIDMLRNKIFQGEFKVGERLPSERELAAKLDVSRNTVRQAYHMLEMLGIVEIGKGSDGGAVIREPSYRSLTQTLNDLMGLRRVKLKDIIEARLYLEKDLVELAFRRATSDDIAELRKYTKKAFDKINDKIPAHKENLEFHRKIADVACNPVLAMVYSSVLDLLYLILETTASLEMSGIIAMEHVQIIDMLEKKDDLGALLSFVEEHIQGSNSRLKSISHDYPLLPEW